MPLSVDSVVPIAQDLMAEARRFGEDGRAAIDAANRRGSEGAQAVGALSRNVKHLVQEGIDNTRHHRDEWRANLSSQVAQSEIAKNLVNLLI